jgi:hypothetical protein
MNIFLQTVKMQIFLAFQLLNDFLFLSEKIGDVDGGEVPCQAWTTRMPKYVQPDLNFVGESVNP